MEGFLRLLKLIWQLEGQEFYVAAGGVGLALWLVFALLKLMFGGGGGQKAAEPETTDTELLLRKVKRLGLTTSELERMWKASKLNDDLTRKVETAKGPMGGNVSSEAMR